MATRIGIVAHQTRAEAAHKLFNTVRAAYLSMDNGTIGCVENHQRVWKYLANSDTEWVVALEDDAKPIKGFTKQLDLALAAAPSPVVSLYLGTSRPKHWQARVKEVTERAKQSDASWITSTHLLHCVGVAVRTELAPVMAKWCTNLDEPLDDHRVGGNVISYTWPSLVDHADETPVVLHPDGEPRDRPRTAWRTGTRDTWTSSSVEIS